MDIFAHALWASAGASKLNDSLGKKEKPKFSVGWATFWGIFPDLLAFGIPSIWFLYLIIFKGVKFSQFSHHGPLVVGAEVPFSYVHYLYQYSHSFVIFAVVFGVVWLIYKRPQVAMLG